MVVRLPPNTHLIPHVAEGGEAAAGLATPFLRLPALFILNNSAEAAAQTSRTKLVSSSSEQRLLRFQPGGFTNSRYIIKT